MTEEERSEIVRVEDHHAKPRWSWIGTVICLVLAATCIASVLSFVYSRSGAATSAQIQESSARTDCRSEYNARLAEVKDGRLDLLSEITEVAVKGDQVTVGRASDSLAKLIVVIHALPRLDVAVDKGFVLHGVHYPPCPG